MTVPERLQLFLEAQEINAYRVNKQAGLSKGLLTKALQGRKGLSSQSLEQILLAYPDLDADWLMTGRGEMIRKEKPAATAASPLPEDLERSLYRVLVWHLVLQDKYTDTHDELDRLIALLDETGERLTSLKKQLATIRSLIETQWELQPSEDGIWRTSLKIAAGDDGNTPPVQLKELEDLTERLRKYLVP